MKIETLEIAGFGSAFKALRLPFGKECRSFSFDTNEVFKVDDESRLAFMGTNFSPQETKEFVIELVCDSNVYIHTKDLALLQSLIKRGDEHAKVMRGIIVYAEITAPVYWWAELETYKAGHERLCSESTMHIDCRKLQGEELQKAKADIPMGKELTKIDFFSYQCLRNMYKQRQNHRLPEWNDTFCKWVESLPLAKELILIEKE